MGVRSLGRKFLSRCAISVSFQAFALLSDMPSPSSPRGAIAAFTSFEFFVASHLLCTIAPPIGHRDSLMKTELCLQLN
ncbi:MAG: hypothetical protein ACK559_18400, partial [bacterium]